MAELYYDEEVCLQRKEERGPWVEEFAMSRRTTHIFFKYDMLNLLYCDHDDLVRLVV